MLDAHCHLDLYKQPSAVADRAERAGVFTVLVTNLPSAFERSLPHVAQRHRIRLALGLHPLLADQHVNERERFRELLPQTSFVGEVGLDFSRDGKPTAAQQLESFEFVLAALGSYPKFVSIHSRRAEAQIVDLLRVAHRAPVVFHWYSGPIKVLEKALADGHYFSINPAMAQSENGRRIIARIPRERALTETDGPFVTLGGRQLEPTDVARVEEILGSIWAVSHLEARSIVATNFQTLVAPLRAQRTR